MKDMVSKSFKSLTFHQVFLISIISVVASQVLLIMNPIRLDFSKQNAYSLSKATKEVLNKNNKKITITAFMSSDIPPRLVPLKRDVLDLLKEYKRASNGQIQIYTKDPKTNVTAQKKAVAAGIPQLQFSEVQKNEYKVSSSFFGLMIEDGQNTAIVPQVVTTATLEYDITSAIYKMNRSISQKIAFINFPQAYDPREDAFTTLKRSLTKQFNIEEMRLSSSSSELDPSVVKAALLVVNGSAISTIEQRDQLSSYLDAGGNVIMFIDGISVSDSLEVVPARHNMFDFLESYGITLEQNLALSYSAQSATFATGLGAFAVKYPLWIATNEFSKKARDFTNINKLVFQWASSLVVNDQKKAKVLVSTPSNSWVQTKNFVVVPNGIPAPSKKSLKSYPLIVESKTKQGGFLLVIPTERFAREQYLAQSGGNIEFIVNVLNRYISNEALSGIRSRSSIYNPLKPLSSTQKDVVRIVVIGVLPFVFILLGAVRIFIRNKRSSA